jgi:hypothetical protein
MMYAVSFKDPKNGVTGEYCICLISIDEYQYTIINQCFKMTSLTSYNFSNKIIYCYNIELLKLNHGRHWET